MPMFDKGRRPWKRGAKMRYSVYKTEDRQEGEEKCKEWAETIAEAKGYNIEDFKPDVECRNFWRETYDRIHGLWLETTYHKELDESDAFLKDLESMIVMHGDKMEVKGDTEALYEKYPTVRIGIRRALVMIKKKQKDAATTKKVRKRR